MTRLSEGHLRVACESAETASESVVLRGRLDVLSVSEVRERLHRAVDTGEGTLVIDLTDVEGVDATGLGMLVGSQRRAERAGRELVLRGTPARLSRLLRATRLDRVLPTCAEHGATAVGRPTTTKLSAA